MAELNARIIAKASGTAGEVPQAADLEVAEIAVNTADGKFFTKHTDGTIKEISGSGGASGSIDDLSDVDTSTNPPTDGQVLSWDSVNSKWEPSDGRDRIQDMDDFELNQALSSQPQTLTASPSLLGGFRWDSPSEIYISGEDNTGTNIANLPSNGSAGTVYVLFQGIIYAIPFDNVFSGSGSTKRLLVSGGYDITQLDPLNDSNNYGKTVEVSFTAPTAVPLAEGDILQWDNADQKFKPAQSSAGGGGGSLADLSDVSVGQGTYGKWNTWNGENAPGGWDFGSGQYLWINYVDSDGTDWTSDFTGYFGTSGTFYARANDGDPWTPVTFTAVANAGTYVQITSAAFASSGVSTGGGLQFSFTFISTDPSDGDGIVYDANSSEWKSKQVAALETRSEDRVRYSFTNTTPGQGLCAKGSFSYLQVNTIDGDGKDLDTLFSTLDGNGLDYPATIYVNGAARDVEINFNNYSATSKQVLIRLRDPDDGSQISSEIVDPLVFADKIEIESDLFMDQVVVLPPLQEGDAITYADHAGGLITTDVAISNCYDYDSRSPVVIYTTQLSDLTATCATSSSGQWKPDLAATTEIIFNVSAHTTDRYYAPSIFEAVRNGGNDIPFVTSTGYNIDTWYRGDGGDWVSLPNQSWNSYFSGGNQYYRMSLLDGTVDFTAFATLEVSFIDPTLIGENGSERDSYIKYDGKSFTTSKINVETLSNFSYRPMGTGYYLRVSGLTTSPNPASGDLNVWSTTQIALSTIDVNGIDRSEFLYGTQYFDTGDVLSVYKEDGTLVVSEAVTGVTNKSGNRATVGMPSDPTTWYGTLSVGDVVFMEFENFPTLYFPKSDEELLTWNDTSETWEPKGLCTDTGRWRNPNPPQRSRVRGPAMYQHYPPT